MDDITLGSFFISNLGLSDIFRDGLVVVFFSDLVMVDHLEYRLVYQMIVHRV